MIEEPNPSNNQTPVGPTVRSRRPHPALRARRVTGLASVVGMLGITGYLAAHAAESVAASANAPAADVETGSATLGLDVTSADVPRTIDAMQTERDDFPGNADDANGERGDRRERGHRRQDDDWDNGYEPPSNVDARLPRASDPVSTNNTNSNTGISAGTASVPAPAKRPATNPQSSSHGS